MAVPGDTEIEKPDAGTTVSAALELALWPFTVTVMAPLPAPGGITNVMLVEVKDATGAERVPPLCCSRVTTGTPERGARLVPVMVMTVPTEADMGVKPLMEGAGLLTVRVVEPLTGVEGATTIGVPCVTPGAGPKGVAVT